jgi:hypothetical protein
MGLDFKVLKSKGLTTDRLKEIFTAKPDQASTEPISQENSKFAEPGEQLGASQVSSGVLNLPENPTDYQIRKFFEERFQRRMQEGWQRSFDSYRLYGPVDIAMDATPITRYNWPLMMMAQGHIDLNQCHREIDGLSPDMSKRLFECDKTSGRPFKVNLPKFQEIQYNLVHSLTTRRVAAVATPISTRFPFLKYDARGTAQVAKLRSDLMTQRAEIMSDQYGYRHDVVQSVRDASCYGHQVEFVRASWDKETQLVRVKRASDGTTGIGPEETDYEEKEIIVREGVEFIAPHPSRVGWDINYPLAKLNSDSGPQFAFFWDITRFGNIRMNTSYYNRDAVELDPAAWELFMNNMAYFQMYYPDTIVFPSNNRLGNLQGMANDRKASLSFYAQADDDIGCSLTYMYERVRPSDFGICDYDGYVWIRFVIGGTKTVIYAEPLPSLPGCVYHYNENDSRIYSPSFAHSVMPFQDQISNLLTQILEVQVQGLTRIFELNKDGMQDADIQKFEDSINNRHYDAAKAILIKYSSEQLKDMNIDPARTQRLRTVEISTTEKTTEIFRTIVQLLSFAERLLFFSPQELGQVAPREITATEANIVNNTTLGIRDFHTVGIEEGLAAKKRIISESTVALGSDEINLPVMDRYPLSVVKKLGAEVIETDGDPDTIETAKSGRYLLSVDSEMLVNDYVFTSRDGLDRPQSTVVAASLTQLLQIIGQSPTLSQVVPRDKLVSLVNEIARNLGSGFDFKLQLPDGMAPQEAAQPDIVGQVKDVIGKMNEAVTTLAQAQQEDRQNLAKVSQAVTNIARTMQAAVAASTNRLPTPAGAVSPTIPNGAPPLNGLQLPMESGALDFAGPTPTT